jgi:acetyl esterase/lipase
VRRARRVFGYGGFLDFLHTRGLKLEAVDKDGVRGEWVFSGLAASPDHVLLYLHGGGYVSCSPRTHRPITTALARLAQCRVFALDYRLAPEHPFPAAVDDAVAAFLWLLGMGISPGRIAVAGDSAGGGLALAMMLRLRSQGIALPACAVCLSPWVDLTGANAYSNVRSCAMFKPPDIISFAGLYLNGVSAETPDASPIFADLKGLPPLLIHASSTELLLADAVRLHEKASGQGIESKLHVYPGLPHVWHVFIGTIPEARHALTEIANFARNAWDPSQPRAASGDSVMTPAYNV